MLLEVIIFVLLAVITIQQFLYFKLIKDLTLKIKAKDLGEYQRATEKPKKILHEEVIPPEDADAREYLEALKK